MLSWSDATIAIFPIMPDFKHTHILQHSYNASNSPIVLYRCSQFPSQARSGSVIIGTNHTQQHQPTRRRLASTRCFRPASLRAVLPSPIARLDASVCRLNTRTQSGNRVPLVANTFLSITTGHK